MPSTDLTIDVAEAAGLGEPAHVGVTVVTPPPDTLGDDPVVAFARPGAGYTHGYFSEALPGRTSSQAEWHARRGWIVVAADPLGVGASSANDPSRLTHGPLVDAADAADRQVLARLAEGTLVAGLPPVPSPVVLGIGQSMGGCLTIVQQAHHRTFDGIAVLGYSARRTEAPVPPGEVPFTLPWLLRDASDRPVVLNEPEVEAQVVPADDVHPALKWLEWGMYGDEAHPDAFADRSRWTTDVYPAVVGTVTTPGSIAQEAAAVRVPVLVAVGDRDVVADLPAEVFAYQSATDIDLYRCPRMAHMHNFAPTAELLWARIHHWGESVRERTRLGRRLAP